MARLGLLRFWLRLGLGDSPRFRRCRQKQARREGRRHIAGLVAGQKSNVGGPGRLVAAVIPSHIALGFEFCPNPLPWTAG